MTCGHLLDDRPEKAVVPLETGLILDQEPVEIMEQHPVESRALRMARTIDSRHIGMDGAGTGPGSKIRKKWIIGYLKKKI